MPESYSGLLFVGDPHLASRTPGFRKDNYPEAILGKLRWTLDLARKEQLLPVILGDLFHWPRGNSNWLLGRLIRLFEGRRILCVTGNHDTTERDLREDDTLAVIAELSDFHLLDQRGPWNGVVNGVAVTIGGSSWSSPLPSAVATHSDTLSIWITHHNIAFATEEDNWIRPHEIPGIHLVVNGHLHRPRPEETCGMTTWLNPGNIARVQRADGVKEAVPSVLKLVPAPGLRWDSTTIPVPHEPYESVFHAPASGDVSDLTGSAFIKGLEALRSKRTEGGAGLVQFISVNIDQFQPEVAEVIMHLLKEVCPDEFVPTAVH